MHNLIEELTCKFELSYSTEWYYSVKYTQRRFKIQDHIIISSEKLKHGWTLTTSQYTVMHILYFKTKEQLLKIQKLRNKQTSKLRNLHTHIHTHTHTHTAMMFEQIYLFRNAIDCISFRYAKSSTQWKKLIMFSKDMAVVIYNKKEGSHLLGDGMPSALLAGKHLLLSQSLYQIGTLPFRSWHRKEPLSIGTVHIITFTVSKTLICDTVQWWFTCWVKFEKN